MENSSFFLFLGLFQITLDVEESIYDAESESQSIVDEKAAESVVEGREDRERHWNGKERGGKKLYLPSISEVPYPGDIVEREEYYGNNQIDYIAIICCGKCN